MNECLSTFAVGLEEPVKSALTEALSEAQFSLTLDGLVVYRTSSPLTVLKRLPFVNNTFVLLRRFDGPSARQPVQIMREALAAPGLERKLRGSVSSRERTFRIVISDGNQTARGDPGLLARLEGKVIATTGLTPHRARPDIEFWFLIRREGCGFFAKRLTRRQATEKTLREGELRPELANVLCRISEPSSDDVFLDPFCGSGAIPLQRAAIPHNLIFASDGDATQVRLLKERIKRLARSKKDPLRKVIVHNEDALNLSRFEDGFIDKIVTDPPWGHFSTPAGGLAAFYGGMVAEMCRIVKGGGVIVLVTAQKQLFEDVLAPLSAKLRLADRYDVLVSGKPAAVFKLRRREGLTPSGK